MAELTERLEIRLPREMAERLRSDAEYRNESQAELVRRALRAYLEESERARRRAAEDLFEVGASVDDWSDMERDIEESYGEEA